MMRGESGGLYLRETLRLRRVKVFDGAVKKLTTKEHEGYTKVHEGKIHAAFPRQEQTVPLQGIVFVSEWEGAISRLKWADPQN